MQIQGVGVRELLRDVLLHDISAAAVGQGLVPRSEQGGRNNEGQPRQEEQASSPLPSQTSERCVQIIIFLAFSDSFSHILPHVRLQSCISIQIQPEWRISSKSGSFLFIYLFLPPHGRPSGRKVGVNVTVEGKLHRRSEICWCFNVNGDSEVSVPLQLTVKFSGKSTTSFWLNFSE